MDTSLNNTTPRIVLSFIRTETAKTPTLVISSKEQLIQKQLTLQSTLFAHFHFFGPESPKRLLYLELCVKNEVQRA